MVARAQKRKNMCNYTEGRSDALAQIRYPVQHDKAYGQKERSSTTNGATERTSNWQDIIGVGYSSSL